MSIWYNSLPWWQHYKVDPKHRPQRKSFIPKISDVAAYYGLKREEVGIYAAPWASMYYQGRWYAVTYKDIEDLSKKGTDIIFIEKQDIVGALGKYASRVGVALVNTRGHLVEYAKDLARLARARGGNIAILTDYDIHGLHIASKLPGVLWLGVDERMLAYFGIVIRGPNTNKNVVDYRPKKKLSKDKIEEIKRDPRFSKDRVDFEFLDRNKVEIDAVLAHLNDQAKPIWDYVQSLLDQEYKTRNYGRVIDARPTRLSRHYPVYVRKYLAYIEKLEEDATAEGAEEIDEELAEVEGFISVEDKVVEIDKRHAEAIMNHKPFSDLAASLEQLDRDKGLGISDIEVTDENASTKIQDYLKDEAAVMIQEEEGEGEPEPGNNTTAAIIEGEEVEEDPQIAAEEDIPVDDDDEEEEEEDGGQ